jgi:hypothetical protein
MARGRPAATSPIWECHIHLRLRVGEDDDLIAFLSKLLPRKRAVSLKTALRTGSVTLSPADDGVSDDELLASLDDFLK